MENHKLQPSASRSGLAALFALFMAFSAAATAMAAPPVTVRQTAHDVIVNNGLIRVDFSRRRARIVSLIDELGGRRQELLNQANGIYFDANGIRTSRPRHPGSAYS